mmetsp:Transcript_47097/g.109940  ORF Transcript_47097/g.109940 Transcript_47097/m.109940 type:complete len:111 (+) Transcript_47097:2-334(+)
MADVTELRRMAEQGGAEAQYAFGNWHNDEQDYAKAAALYHRAADQGHLDAQCELGLLYRDGTGVPQDDREAARLFRRAANKGHAGAQCELAACFRSGRVALPDLKHAGGY